MLKDLTDEQLDRRVSEVMSEVGKRRWRKVPKAIRTDQGRLMAAGRKMTKAQLTRAGKKGGAARAESISKEQRSAIASKGGLARMAKLRAAKVAEVKP